MSPTIPNRILLEVCIASVEDAVTAEQCGADRLELNSALSLGGLTPSLAVLTRIKQACSLPVVAMVRPREGGFCYSAAEFLVMQRELELLLEHGSDGVAFGVLDENGELDVTRNERLARQAEGREVVFHRAFDVVPQPLTCLRQLIDIGIDRVLTSGQAARAEEGVELLEELQMAAADELEILPAVGIHAENAAMVIQRTGCRQLHASLRETVSDGSCRHNPQVEFSHGSGNKHYRTNPQQVLALRQALDSIV